jgi:hypothetical protein
MPLMSPHFKERVTAKLASVHWIPKLTVGAVGESPVLNIKKIGQLQFACAGGKIYNASPSRSGCVIEERPPLPEL